MTKKEMTQLEKMVLEALFPSVDYSTPQCPWLLEDHPTLQSYELDALNEHQLMLEEMYPERSPEELKAQVLYTIVNILEIAEREVKSWPKVYSYAAAADATKAYLRMSHPQYGPLVTAMLNYAASLGYKNLDQES